MKRIVTKQIVSRCAVWLMLLGVVALVGWRTAPPAAGQAPTTRQGVPARPAPARGTIDATYSRAYVHVGKTGLGHEHAVVGYLAEGVVHLGAAQNAGQLVFDMRRFVADTEEARKYIGLEGTSSASTQQQVTANMLGRDVLDVATHPTAVFKIRSAMAQGAADQQGQPVRLEGEFTLHGVTRPLVIDCRATDLGRAIRLRGAFAIAQTHYGITPYSKAFGTIGVADKMTIYGELYLAK